MPTTASGATPDRLSNIVRDLVNAVQEEIRAAERDAARPVLYTTEEAAEILGCARSTVWRLMATGRLRSVKIGGLRRIPATAIAELQEPAA